ncbi:hypothetical protein [Streptomyces sp. NBRC 110611]|uniref:hypothetical protein n=1 Tax=Streptomyces sp. NBRC 110611 TaxID=1621259 RepID=UPI00099F74D0|nr:hypothetical protein [Streptomyces sp. NBRC 110611]
MRGLLVRRVVRPLTTDRAAPLRFAGVLDGHTLNLHGTLPMSFRSAHSATVVLRRGRVEHCTPVRLRPRPGGPPAFDAAVLLGAEMDGVPVGHGPWRMALAVHSRRGVHLLRLLPAEGPAADYNGPTGPVNACQRTGRRYRVGSSLLGYARLVVARPLPRAEVDRVEVRHHGIAVCFHGVGDTGGAPDEIPAALLVRGEAAIACPAPEFTGQDGVLRFEVPLGSIRPAGRRTEAWDFYVRWGGESGRPLRLGRRLHDVSDPRGVFAIRPTVVSDRRGGLVRVHLYYTDRGSLRMACTRLADDADTA